MKPRILLYRVKPEKAKQICQAVLPMGIQVRTVLEDELSKTVETLATEPLQTAAVLEGGCEDRGEVLVMCGFSKLQFDLFMGLFQRKKLSAIPVKAMMTEHNKVWPFQKLVEEVWEEHQQMTQGNR